MGDDGLELATPLSSRPKSAPSFVFANPDQNLSFVLNTRIVKS